MKSTFKGKTNFAGSQGWCLLYWRPCVVKRATGHSDHPQVITSQPSQPTVPEPSLLCPETYDGRNEITFGFVWGVLEAVFWRMLFFLYVVYISFMPFCSHYKGLKSLLFQHRSDCRHCPAELREPVKGRPHQTLAWQLVCCEHSLQIASAAYICLLILFSCYFIWFVFPKHYVLSHFPWLPPHRNISMYFFFIHWNLK